MWLSPGCLGAHCFTSEHGDAICLLLLVKPVVHQCVSHELGFIGAEFPFRQMLVPKHGKLTSPCSRNYATISVDCHQGHGLQWWTCLKGGCEEPHWSGWWSWHVLGWVWRSWVCIWRFALADWRHSAPLSWPWGFCICTCTLWWSAYFWSLVSWARISWQSVITNDETGHDFNDLGKMIRTWPVHMISLEGFFQSKVLKIIV